MVLYMLQKPNFFFGTNCCFKKHKICKTKKINEFIIFMKKNKNFLFILFMCVESVESHI